MSEPVSALNREIFSGIVTVREAGPRGMITLRGDLASTALRNAATGVAGLDFPDMNGANCVGERGLCWMSPDEMLVLLPHADVPGAVSAMETSLKGEHALVVDVSDARASFYLEGEGALLRETLAKLTPADMRATSLPTGEMRRTRLAQVPAALWFHEENLAEVICFRSVARYVFGILSHAATPGSEVGYF